MENCVYNTPTKHQIFRNGNDKLSIVINIVTYISTITYLKILGPVSPVTNKVLDCYLIINAISQTEDENTE